MLSVQLLHLLTQEFVQLFAAESSLWFLEGFGLSILEALGSMVSRPAEPDAAAGRVDQWPDTLAEQACWQNVYYIYIYCDWIPRQLVTGTLYSCWMHCATAHLLKGFLLWTLCRWTIHHVARSEQSAQTQLCCSHIWLVHVEVYRFLADGKGFGFGRGTQDEFYISITHTYIIYIYT